MNEKNKPDRRKFLRNSLTAGVGMFAVGGSALASDTDPPTEKIKVLTTDGNLIEVDKPASDCAISPCTPPKGLDARKGIPGRSFVMVIDLARCANARKCIDACQHGHDLMPDQEYMKVLLMRETPESDPYWMPKNCFHCDDPPCVKVCPVGATFKRTDNIVLVDSDTCIGCKFCVSACPYSARIFNWTDNDKYSENDPNYSPETNTPGQHGVVNKCDFCPDRAREGKLPYCATSCPMGAIYFGDKNEDSVTNGEDTHRFKDLIKERAGYRYLEELGTDPNVYYLPPINRMFPYERGFNTVSEEKKKAIEASLERQAPK